MSETSEEARLKKRTRELVETWSSAWDSKDAAAAASFYSKAPGLVFFDLGPIHIGWNQYRKSIEESFESIQSLKLTLNDDLKVVVEGSLALTTATGHISERTKDGGIFDGDIRFTGVWERRGRDWELIHDHWSRLNRPSPSK